jgi:hypothetical protein
MRARSTWQAALGTRRGLQAYGNVSGGATLPAPCPALLACLHQLGFSRRQLFAQRVQIHFRLP